MRHRPCSTIQPTPDAGTVAAVDAGTVGVELEPAAIRVERLAEAVEILQALFRGERVDRDGKHYLIVGAEGVPGPVQQPRPPLIIGGGGRQILSLAGRCADIVGIHLQQSVTGDLINIHAEYADDRLAQKVSWIRAAADEAGREPDEIELQLSMVRVRVHVDGLTHEWHSSQDTGVVPEFATLDGTPQECVETLQALRERHGISYVHLGNNVDAAAPIVAALAGH